MNPQTNRTLALAGILQALQLVKQVARDGRWQEPPFEATIGSLFHLSQGEVAAIYGGPEGLSLGLRTLAGLLDGGSARDLELTRYSAGILLLERKLAHRPEVLEQIREGIEGARRQAEHFSLTHPNVLANLADLYQRTISTLGPRIMVQGEPQHLNLPDHQNRIRALLLASIRATLLWRHLGGSKWQLLFQRGALAAETRRLLDQVHD